MFKNRTDVGPRQRRRCSAAAVRLDPVLVIVLQGPCRSRPNINIGATIPSRVGLSLSLLLYGWFATRQGFSNCQVRVQQAFVQQQPAQQTAVLLYSCSPKQPPARAGVHRKSATRTCLSLSLNDNRNQHPNIASSPCKPASRQESPCAWRRVSVMMASRLEPIQCIRTQKYQTRAFSSFAFFLPFFSEADKWQILEPNCESAPHLPIATPKTLPVLFTQSMLYKIRSSNHVDLTVFESR